MNARCTLLLVVGAICLAVPTRAHALGLGLGKHSADDQSGQEKHKIQSDEQLGQDKNKDKSDQRLNGSLRTYLDVSDAEWQVLLPHITKVQYLSKQLRALKEGGKSFDLDKTFKLPKELRNDDGQQAAQPAAPASSRAVADFSEKSRQLRVLLQDKNSRAADIRTTLAAFRVARAEALKQVAQELAQARSQLSELLTVRQETVCVVSGLIE